MPAAASPRGIAKRRQAIAEGPLKIAEVRLAIVHRVAKGASGARSVVIARAAIPQGLSVEPSVVPKEPSLVLKEQRERPAHLGQTSSAAHAPALKVLRKGGHVRVARRTQALRIARNASELQIVELQIVANMARPKANSAAASARAVHLGPLAVASAATSLLVSAPSVLAKAQIARASVPLGLDRHASDRAVPVVPRVMASGRHAVSAEAKPEAPGPTVPSESRKGIAQPVAQAASSAVQADQDGPVARHVPVLSAVRHVATANHARPSVRGRRVRKATVPSSGRILPQAIVLKDARPAVRHPPSIVRSTDSRLVHAPKALLHGQKAPVHAQRAVTAQRGLSVPGARAPADNDPAVPADSASQVADPNHSASPASASHPTASLQAIAPQPARQAQSVPVHRGLHLVPHGPHLVRGPAPVHASPSANCVPGVQLPEDRAPQARARVAPLQPQVPASRAVPVALANPAHLVNRALPVARPPREASVTSSHAASPRLPNVLARNVPAALQLPNANRAAKETKAS